jgi:hypothetical protein
MVVLGLILLLAAAALVLLLVTAGTSQDVVLDLIGDQQLTTVPAWVFLAGAVTLALAEIGLLLVSRGTRRAVARRREMRELRRAATVPAGRHEGEPRADAGADVTQDRPATDDGPDRTLVRNVDDLRARDAVGPGTGHRQSPGQDADPEAGRHELGPDGTQAPERGP